MSKFNKQVWRDLKKRRFPSLSAACKRGFWFCDGCGLSIMTLDSDHDEPAICPNCRLAKCHWHEPTLPGIKLTETKTGGDQ